MDLITNIGHIIADVKGYVVRMNFIRTSFFRNQFPSLCF
jgi:hypothetical protein